jgi:hypothetical protein
MEKLKTFAMVHQAQILGVLVLSVLILGYKVFVPQKR